MIKNKELSKKDNPFKYFGKLTLIALFLIGISIVFLTFIIRVIFRIWYFCNYKMYIKNKSHNTKCECK